MLPRTRRLPNHGPTQTTIITWLWGRDWEAKSGFPIERREEKSSKRRRFFDTPPPATPSATHCIGSCIPGCIPLWRFSSVQIKAPQGGLSPDETARNYFVYADIAGWSCAAILPFINTAHGRKSSGLRFITAGEYSPLASYSASPPAPRPFPSLLLTKFNRVPVLDKHTRDLRWVNEGQFAGSQPCVT